MTRVNSEKNVLFGSPTLDINKFNLIPECTKCLLVESKTFELKSGIPAALGTRNLLRGIQNRGQGIRNAHSVEPRIHPCL